MLLSIGMMVKNEEKYLDKCLNSLSPILENLDSELIIVDTGSMDNTVQIAKKYTDKVYFHKWNNNFSEMRNITLSYCTGEWFFYVDGDEIIENCDDIIDFFQSKLYKKYNSATINIKNIIDLNDETKFSIFPALRLFKKEKGFKFVNAVHNQPLYKVPIKELSTKCMHYGYISTDKELMERKYKRTVGILKKELEKNPDNIYYLHQLSVSYGMHNELDKAAESIQKAYDCMILKKEDPAEHIYLFPQLCTAYFNVKNYMKVEKYAKETLKYDKNLIDIYYFLGMSSMLLNKNREAIDAFESYLKIYNNYYSSERNIGVIDYTLDRIDEVYFNLYKLNKDAKEYDKAEKYLLSIDSSKYDLPINMVEMCINAKEYWRLKRYEESLILNNESDDLNKLHDDLEDAYMLIDHDEVIKLIKIFSTGDLLYNKLNSIRIEFESKKNVDISTVSSLLNEVELSTSPFYYGDLIYYMIYNENDISDIVENLSFEKINEYLEYLTKKYKEFDNLVYNYILKFKDSNDFYSISINKELARYLIILDKLPKDKLENVYDYYLKIGLNYIKLVYSNFVLENELWQVVRNSEERFFVYINKAMKFKETDKKSYFKYLKAALDFYPLMKNVVEYLLNSEKQKISDENDEFESYKSRVKSTIKSLIDNGDFNNAESIIKEYESIVPDDIDIVLFKSQISLKGLKSKVNDDGKYKM